MQPEDIFALRSASDAQPSPDGSRIAYVVTELDRAADRARSSIWRRRRLAAARHSASPPPRDCSQPRWSPDGQQLAFIATASTARRSGCWPLDGGDAAVPLTDVPGGVTGPPVWSPGWAADRVYGARLVSGRRRAAGHPPTALLAQRRGYIGDGFWHVFTVPVDGAATRCSSPAATGTTSPRPGRRTAPTSRASPPAATTGTPNGCGTCTSSMPKRQAPRRGA